MTPSLLIQFWFAHGPSSKPVSLAGSAPKNHQLRTLQSSRGSLRRTRWMKSTTTLGSKSTIKSRYIESKPCSFHLARLAKRPPRRSSTSSSLTTHLRDLNCSMGSRPPASVTLITSTPTTSTSSSPLLSRIRLAIFKSKKKCKFSTELVIGHCT